MVDFDEQELQLIQRLSVRGGWDVADAEPLKKKIRDYFLAIGVVPCCYCGLTMSPWHRITIDTEHVLPKGRFPEFTFELKNLNISCRRCNMTIKGEKISFYLGTTGETNPFRSELYSFLHPNFDVRSAHLRIVMMQIDGSLYLKYIVTPGSDKGAETYRFFRLEELEEDAFDRAQGETSAAEIEDLPPDIASRLREIIPRSGEI